MPNIFNAAYPITYHPINIDVGEKIYQKKYSLVSQILMYT